MLNKALALAMGCLMLGTTAWAQAAGSVSAGKAKSGACVACHGVDGNSMNPLWPKLAGQSADYLLKQLQDFKSGARQDPLMSGMAMPLSAQDMADLAAYYSSQKIQLGEAKSEAPVVKKGERLYRGGNAEMGVSACMSCHGPAGHGIPSRFPRVSGQHADYTKKQMLDFKASKRSNDGDIMTRIAFRMSEAEISAVAEYMAGLH